MKHDPSQAAFMFRAALRLCATDYLVLKNLPIARSVADLAERCQLRTSTAEHALDRLQAAGLITVTADSPADDETLSVNWPA